MSGEQCILSVQESLALKSSELTFLGVTLISRVQNDLTSLLSGSVRVSTSEFVYRVEVFQRMCRLADRRALNGL